MATASRQDRQWIGNEVLFFDLCLLCLAWACNKQQTTSNNNHDHNDDAKCRSIQRHLFPLLIFCCIFFCCSWQVIESRIIEAFHSLKISHLETTRIPFFRLGDKNGGKTPGFKRGVNRQVRFFWPKSSLPFRSSQKKRSRLLLSSQVCLHPDPWMKLMHGFQNL